MRINDSLIVSGELTINNGSQQVGRLLQSDSNGVGTWVDFSSAGSNFSKVIFVDDVNGSDDPSTNRGQTGYPYKTLEGARDGASPVIISLSGILTSGSTTVSGLSSTASLYIGQKVGGDGIVPGTTIQSIPTGNSVVLSVSADKNLNPTTIVFYDSILVYVMPGTYNVITSSGDGLAKQGVDWYFSPSTFINKNTSNPLFNLTDPDIEFNVLGYGTFNISSSFVNITITTYKSMPKIVLEGNSVTSISDSTIVLLSGSIIGTSVTIKFNDISSSGGSSLWLNSIYATVNVNSIYSSASCCIYHYLCKLYLNAINVISTANIGIYDGDSYARINIGLIQGIGWGYYISSGQLIGIVGVLYNLYNTNGIVNIVGSIYGLYNGNYLNCTDLYIGDYGGSYILISASSWSMINVDNLHSSYATLGFWNLSSGIIKIKNTYSYRSIIYVDGADVIFNDIFDISDWTDQIVNCNSGRVTVNGVLKSTNSGSLKYIHVVVNGGDFILNGRIEYTLNYSNVNGYFSHCIYWMGGNVVLNGSVITRPNPYLAMTPPNFITVPEGSTCSNNLIVLAGGISVNGNSDEILTGRKWKIKSTIDNPDSWTLISLENTIYQTNSGSASNTKSQLASSMVTAINLGATSSIAFQDTPGVDEYYYIEAKNIGDNIPYTSGLNSTTTWLQLESKSLNNITGGQIIENIYVI